MKTQELPLHTYADGRWYFLTEEERSGLSAIVISNNFVIGEYTVGFYLSFMVEFSSLLQITSLDSE